MIKFSSALLIFMLLPQLACACMFPEQGEEYDALIKIEKQQGENTYKLSVPRLVKNSSGWPTVTLIYSSDDSDKNCREETLSDGTLLSCFPQNVIREEIVLNSAWGKAIDWISSKPLYEGVFEVIERENFSVELSVMWETEVCLTVGRAEIIK